MPTLEQANGIRQRVVINLDACIECRSCAAACFYGHNELPIVHFARFGAVMLPAMCRQCLDAPCVEACPADAMKQDAHGAVYRCVFICRGCGSCTWACPFGMLDRATYGGQIARCDLCRDRLDTGELPRCVESCPTGALRFMEEAEAEADGLVVLGSRTIGQHPIQRR